MKKFLCKTVPVFIILTLCFWNSTDPLRQWEKFSVSADKTILMKWMKYTALSIEMKERELKSLNITLPPVYGSTGLFITLIQKGKIRGCFGAFDHSETDISLMLRNYLKGALSYDPRYKPLERYEIEEMDIVITIASHPEQVENLNSIDISHFGVFIECDSTSGIVVVPAEFRTTSRLNRNNNYTNCRISRFRAVTIREDKK